jgi:hypothetical protein
VLNSHRGSEFAPHVTSRCRFHAFQHEPWRSILGSDLSSNIEASLGFSLTPFNVIVSLTSNSLGPNGSPLSAGGSPSHAAWMAVLQYLQGYTASPQARLLPQHGSVPSPAGGEMASSFHSPVTTSFGGYIPTTCHFIYDLSPGSKFSSINLATIT